jgi:transposase-like protein
MPARTTYRRTFRLVRGLKTPELVIVDGAPGLEKAITALWSDIRGEARPTA